MRHANGVDYGMKTSVAVTNQGLGLANPTNMQKPAGTSVSAGGATDTSYTIGLSPVAEHSGVIADLSSAGKQQCSFIIKY